MPDSVSGESVHFTPSIHDLRVDRSIVEQDLGYRDGTTPEPVRETVDELLPLVPAYLKIQCGFRILPAGTVRREKETIVGNGVSFSTGAIIAKQLRQSISLALYVATAGPAIGRWSAELMASGDMLKGYIVDAIASEVVEQTSAWLEQRIEETVKQRGWSITNRYSPGYCDWPVSDQAQLFSLLPPNFCDITLTASSLMMPIKSLSGVIGLGPGVERGEFQCSICDLKDCFRRRESA